jgi:hypothetical protein
MPKTYIECPEIHRLPNTGLHDFSGTYLKNNYIVGYFGKCISKDKKNSSQRSHLWIVRCICGNYYIMSHSNIRKTFKKNISILCSDCKRNKFINQQQKGEIKWKPKKADLTSRNQQTLTLTDAT